MTRTALTVLLFACLMESGCLDWNTGFDKRSVREDRGPLLADDVELSVGTHDASLAFTADGAEVVYVAQARDGSAYVLCAVTIADGTTRVLGGARPISGTPLAPTQDGAALYYFDGDGSPSPDSSPPAFELREALSGTKLPLPITWEPRMMLVASPSGRELLVGDGGGTLLLSLETGETTRVACGDPAVFSPGSDALLCEGSSNPTSNLSLVPLAGQVLPPLGNFARGGRPAALSWTENGMRVAFYPWGLVVGDPATGRELFDAGDGDLSSRAMVFTPDGAAVAYTKSECLAGDMFACTRYERQLVLVEVATGEERTIASSAVGSIRMAMSPDGKTIAYTFDSELHVRPTGR